MKRVIITGATGTIGTALIKELIKQNTEVLVLCHRYSKRISNIPQSPLVTLKECSLDELSSLENDTGKEYDVFYHFAWQGTNGNDRNNYELQIQNVKFALDAVDVAKRFGCKKFIGAGSQAEYGRVEGVLKPDTPTNPEMGYGVAKLCAGQMTKLKAHSLGMQHVWMRVLSIFGPNDGVVSMVASTIIRLRNGETPQFTKGEQIWDYLYSGDAAEAFCLVGEKGIDGSVYVLGSGKPKPLRDYIEALRDVVSPGAELDFGAVPYGEKQVMYLCADVSKLQQDTGWESTTEFSEGIRQILENDFAE